jgi:hypothetical protein
MEVAVSLTPADYQRVCIHESSHALIAVHRGFFVFRLMFDGPANKPAAVWRETPPGQYVETDSEWAKREIAVLVAGFLGEREFYKQEKSEFLTGAGGDLGQIDYAAFHAVRNERDLRSARLSKLDSSEWRTKLRGVDWKPYDALVKEIAAEVAVTINKRRSQIEAIAKRLLAHGCIRGKFVYETMGLKWPGEVRTADWVDFK